MFAVSSLLSCSSVTVTMASLRPTSSTANMSSNSYSQYQPQYHHHSNRRSNSRNRSYFHHYNSSSTAAFVARNENTKRARTYKASSSTTSHMQGSCETRQQKLASSSNSTSSNNVSDQDNKNTKEKECVKLVTYPIMQVWKLYKYTYEYTFIYMTSVKMWSWKTTGWSNKIFTVVVIHALFK